MDDTLKLGALDVQSEPCSPQRLSASWGFPSYQLCYAGGEVCGKNLSQHFDTSIFSLTQHVGVFVVVCCLVEKYCPTLQPRGL